MQPDQVDPCVKGPSMPTPGAATILDRRASPPAKDTPSHVAPARSSLLRIPPQGIFATAEISAFEPWRAS
jgi:hypothetical protein